VVRYARRIRVLVVMVVLPSHKRVTTVCKNERERSDAGRPMGRECVNGQSKLSDDSSHSEEEHRQA